MKLLEQVRQVARVKHFFLPRGEGGFLLGGASFLPQSFLKPAPSGKIFV